MYVRQKCISVLIRDTWILDCSDDSIGMVLLLTNLALKLTGDDTVLPGQVVDAALNQAILA